MSDDATTFRARPEATTRSYELIWKDNIPTVRPSNWAPGYTPGHMATVDEAVKYGMHRLTKDLADMREKWVNMNALQMSLAVDDMNQADSMKAIFSDNEEHDETT
ncbi:MAG: hypothetical protein RR853_08880 [Aurantimicrobium sp.]|uniref:hypothetical protein n=1 Tax=Aurantimicrobium sp. TaxID=1930784 RepID=UPI002FC9C0E7